MIISSSILHIHTTLNILHCTPQQFSKLSLHYSVIPQYTFHTPFSNPLSILHASLSNPLRILSILSMHPSVIYSIILWYPEEGSHGVLSEQWWGAVRYLNSSNSQRPDICPGIIVVIQLLLTRYHLQITPQRKFIDQLHENCIVLVIKI